MIGREDFMFTVGYQGNTAIVDGISRGKYSRLSIQELSEKGMFKPALCAALYSGKTEDLSMVLMLYNQHAAREVPSIDELKKVYGVSKLPDEIEKVIRL